MLPITLLEQITEAMEQTAYLGDTIYAGIYSPL